MAPALHGVIQIVCGFICRPDCIELDSSPLLIRTGIDGEKDIRYSEMKNISLRRHTVKRTSCDQISLRRTKAYNLTYSVRVVYSHNPWPALVHLLMTLRAATHHKCRVHVYIMAGKIQADQALKDDTPSRKCTRQED